MFRAFGYNLREEDYELIRRMVSTVTREPVEITDLLSYEMTVTSEDIVFLFGLKAKKKFAGKTAKKIAEFPDPIRLDAAFGEQEERVSAHKLLKQLEREIREGIKESVQIETSEQIITPSDLPKLSCSEVKALEDSLREKGISEWRGTTEGGATVRLTIDSETSSAEMNLTFAELFGLKLAMDTLQVREIEIVYKPSIRSEENSFK